MSDNRGFGDDGSVIRDGGDETAGVDSEVFRRSGHGEVDDFFFEGETEGREGDVGSVGPGTVVVGIENNLGGLVGAHFEDINQD